MLNTNVQCTVYKEVMTCVQGCQRSARSDQQEMSVPQPDVSLDLDRKYRLEKQIGRGGFGTVYSALRIEDGNKVAVKQICKNRVQSWGQIEGQSYPKEVCILLHLSKVKSVIDLYDCYQNENAYLLGNMFMKKNF
ncbi:serine/threonine-protein kinase prk-2 [Eurytemora carolleeae]|uniref:serine/threonine-protein kinase prk-2 n=1 Tax=Eurytemora carolleeae TaxID=1294199 RepID=UPI000C77CC00|nr:serine/threonine-protein kinase prk-2 [Eurytemora carolleeae]|eukprot:XP_023331147.1 serine/threonine-protein kinase prk-2-like [Eurytemora affinis]